VRSVIEGYHAAALEDASAPLIAEDAWHSRKDFKQYRSADGYDHVISSLERGLSGSGVRIRLQTRVRLIGWARDEVTVACETPRGQQELHARCCVVTVSLGVLQAMQEEGIVLSPAPQGFVEAVSRLGMGHVRRVVLRLTRRLWPAAVDDVEVTFAQVPGAPFPTLWREGRAGQEQVTAWAGGPQASALATATEPELVTAALESLARASGADLSTCRSALIEAHQHDFSADPWVRGAYSYARVGAGDAARVLAQGWADTLFFAGEALDLQYPGTIAGALGSGEHAARRLLSTWPG
jgi:monoamine oxidase